MGSQNKVQEPSADALLECFEIFDTNKNGQISADVFRKIMAGKLGTETGEVEEGVWSAGTVMGLIDSVVTCHQLCTDIVRSAQTAAQLYHDNAI